jgi:hypothetical protein
MADVGRIVAVTTDGGIVQAESATPLRSQR